MTTRKAQLLTVKSIEALKPDPSGAYRVPDTRAKGLALRVAADGGKTWGVAYRIKGMGVVKRCALGRYEDVGLEDARRKANELTLAGREGRDLIAERETARDDYDASFTVERLIAEYAKRRLHGRAKTAEAIERRLKRTLESVLTRKAGDLRRRDLRQILDAVVDDGRTGEAEKRRSTLQPMFRWALAADIIEMDPTAGLSPYGRSLARDRVLDHDEIRKLWEWLETDDMPSHVADILKLQLCLGARVGELCGMTSAELQNDAGSMLWILPATRSKSGFTRITPILGLALEIIKRRIGEADTKPIFTSVDDVVSSTSLVGHAIIARRKRTPIKPFTSHDLRRTVATEMAKLGLPLELVATVLGQRAGEAETRVLRKHYIHNQFVDRKAAALGRWDALLRQILAGEASGKVISLRA